MDTVNKPADLDLC